MTSPFHLEKEIQIEKFSKIIVYNGYLIIICDNILSIINDKHEIIKTSIIIGTKIITHAIVFDEYLVLFTIDTKNMEHILYLNRDYVIVLYKPLYNCGIFPLQVKNHILFCCAYSMMTIYKFDKTGYIVPVVLKENKGIPNLFDDKLVFSFKNNIFFMDYDGNILKDYNLSTLTSVFETFIINDKLYCIDYNGNIYVYDEFSMMKLNQIPSGSYEGTYNDFIIFKLIDSDGMYRSQLHFYKKLSFSQMEGSYDFDFNVSYVLSFKDKLVVAGLNTNDKAMIQFLNN